jgi:CRISPR-associated protein Cmr6
MTATPIQRPNRPIPRSNPSVERSKPTPARIGGGGGGNAGGGGGNAGGGAGDGGGGGGGQPQPSPWLNDQKPPTIDSQASFVEYLRWMRSPDSQYKDPTKVQILQMAQDQANYGERLKQLNQRTRLIAGAGNTFEVKCSWRIRVGGHRGPESILLPAFDALGMPYIPSSTLRGVARTQAIREIMATDRVEWKEAEKKIAPYFGSLEAENKDKAGKVVFFDAYPLPDKCNLAMDMANNIWKWDNDELKYDPNPNPFFSLKEPTFLIGIRLASGCKDSQVLEKVKQWLLKGLQAGVGSQVNTGYGNLSSDINQKSPEEFFRVEFGLEGQLIHGHQRFTQWNLNSNNNQWQMRGQAVAEVRSIAFKSLLRYWFRAFALGVLPTDRVKEWEAKLFGSINPQTRGWVRFEILKGKITRPEPRSNRDGRNDASGEQEGILSLSFSSEPPETQKENLKKLFFNLTWLMFNLGGIGQGARRPCYSRQDRPDPKPPWYRGSTFLAPETPDRFWQAPESVTEFSQLLRRKLENFYQALGLLTNIQVNYTKPKTVGTVNAQSWTEAIDANCRIVVCSGKEDFNKPYALAVLHSDQLKEYGRYDGNLCGKVAGGVKPSPVWIADSGDYQVVTVFGATQNPRKQYLEGLRNGTNKNNYVQVFPFT